MRVKRSDMKPGTIFGNRTEIRGRGWYSVRHDALVVIDRYFEISFWTGALCCYGDVMPAMEFEVLA